MITCIPPAHYNEAPLCKRCGRMTTGIPAMVNGRVIEEPCNGPFSLSELMSEIASILDRDRHLPQHERTKLSLYLIDVGSNRIKESL